MPRSKSHKQKEKGERMKAVIMAGGTGGHIFPGIAVAKELIKQGVEVVWLGAKGGMEERLVKEHNIPLELLAIKGLRGKGLKGLLALPFKLFSATKHAAKYMKQEKVSVALSMGGYVAGPGGLAAKLKGIPLVVHEQNSKFGMTNRYLSKWAKKVLTGFDLKGVFNSQWVGNPVRSDIEHCEKNTQRNGTVKVFVLGGSLGAKSLNTRIPKLVNTFANIEVIHQCGKNKKTETAEHYGGKEKVEVHEFIQDMCEVYAWADFVIARAGALTIAEINAIGLPAIFVPYPYAVDDHQTSNAQNVVDHKAAFIWQEKQDELLLKKHMELLISNKEVRSEMAQRSRKLHQEGSAEKVAKACMELGL